MRCVCHREPVVCIGYQLPLLYLQISQAFKPEHDDVEYAQGKYMLQMLGLQVTSLVVSINRRPIIHLQRLNNN